MNPIVIIEDEHDLASVIADYLAVEDYQVHCLYDGEEALQWLKNNTARLIILDLMLPGADGLTICRELRKTSDTPVIMATAKVEEIDRLIGLDLGADDYICKPYSPKELVARVRAVLRRYEKPNNNSKAINLDKDAFLLTLGEDKVELTAIETRLFDLLLSQPGKIFSRQYIMDNIYTDYRVVSDRTVDSHVKKLRKKISDSVPGLDLIHSIYGAGYKYEYQEN